jgi:hypothetical protein
MGALEEIDELNHRFLKLMCTFLDVKSTPYICIRIYRVEKSVDRV